MDPLGDFWQLLLDLVPLDKRLGKGPRSQVLTCEVGCDRYEGPPVETGCPSVSLLTRLNGCLLTTPQRGW